MSYINVNAINNEAGTGAPNFPNGLSVNSNPLPTAGSLSNRNRIINGAMVIDQRNAGAALVAVAGIVYTLDRWGISGSSKFSVQRNAGSVTPPAGFANYAGITSLSAYTPTGNEGYQFYQVIEGFNTTDLNWGTASAVPATLSFWVRSSLTGTFGGSIATTKTSVWSMPFTFTISSANTWTYITVAIAAPTATGGTNTDNTAGIYVRFGLGSAGTSLGGTAGVWGNNNFIQPSGTVSLVSTNGATFYITGVQLEAGDTATPFEHRQYGQELALCQRYYNKSYPPDLTPGIAATAGYGAIYATEDIGNIGRYASPVRFPVVMRATPTVTVYPGRNDVTATAGYVAQYNAAVISAVTQGPFATATGWNVIYAGSYDQLILTYTADAEL